MTAEEALRLRDLLLDHRNTNEVITRREVLDALDLRSDARSLPDAGFLPEPRRDLGQLPAQRALKVDRDANAISTSDGYRVELADDRVKIFAPGSKTPDTVINGRNVTEADGTKWKAEDGNFVLPNNAMIRLEYEGDHISRFTMQHGDGKVDAKGMGYGDGSVDIGKVKSGGYDFRTRLVEETVDQPTYRMGGYFDGKDALDVTWNRERYGENEGRMVGRTVDGADYVVNPELKPQFGTPDYERMMRAEVKDLYATISGNLQAGGESERSARQLANTYLGSTGIYDQYAREIRASELGGVDQTRILDMLEGMRPMFDPRVLSGAGAESVHAKMLEALGMGGGLEQLAMQQMLASALQSAGQLAPQGAQSLMGELVMRQLLDTMAQQMGAGSQRAQQPGLAQQLAAVQQMMALVNSAAASESALASQTNPLRSFLPKHLLPQEPAELEGLVDLVLRGEMARASRGERFDVGSSSRSSRARTRDRLSHEARYLERKIGNDKHRADKVIPDDEREVVSKDYVRLGAIWDSDSRSIIKERDFGNRESAGRYTPGEARWYHGNGGDGRSLVDLDLDVLNLNKADMWGGVTQGHDVTDVNGRVVAKDTTHAGVGMEANLEVAALGFNIGDEKGLGYRERIALEGDLYAGVEVSGKANSVGDTAIAGKVGAYAGVDAVGESGIGFRYFGFGGKASVGAGVGATVEGHASNEDGRLSIGAGAKVGVGPSAGVGASAWIDYGQMWKDIKTVGGWLGIGSGS